MTSGLFIYFHISKISGNNQQSNYEIYSQNQLLIEPSTYFSQTVESDLYKPVGVWSGRLVLPKQDPRQDEDFVGFEVHHTDEAHRNLIGQVVTLRWSTSRQVQQYVLAVTKDVRFTEETKKSLASGNLHPKRLNNWRRVGPLGSLAGARPKDDVIVMLQDLVFVERKGSDRPSLVITQEPVQITGSVYGLVTMIKCETTGSNRFIVRHFNPRSKQFNGPLESIRIPQVPPDRNGIPRSSNRGIEKSPLNAAGWYIYGAKDAKGIFVVQAIAPRAIFRLQPDEVRLGLKAGLNYINHENWKNTEAQKGKAKTVLLDPSATQVNEAISQWREGDRAIVMHLFGGIGGKKAEPAMLGVVTGHFSYGFADVVRDPLTSELRFEIVYQQVYAHNPDGIVAGAIAWSGYMGDLQRGWLGNRPVCDVIIKLDAVTQDYDFDGIQVSPMAEFRRQLEIMTARYRIGDGTGAALVTPAKSCVQDSNQALYITLKKIEREVESNRGIQDWLQRYPTHSQTRRFEELVKLGRSLEKQLTPLGIVRSDWQENAKNLAGTRLSGGLIRNILTGITSWRTLLPRRAHDEIASIFLKNGAKLWFIRTNQLGGFDPDIKPKAPTALLGHRTN